MKRLLIRSLQQILLTINRVSLSVGNEQADAGRDGRTCLTRPNDSQARAGTGEN